MARAVRDLMTPNPTLMPAGAPLAEAAQVMRDQGIGVVVVVTDAGPAVLTDRDIVIRAVADGEDAASMPVGSVCSTDVVSVGPDTDVDDAVALMRTHAVRRLLVLDGGRPVGIVSIGDLATELDPDSALGGISRAVPNR